MVWWYVFFVDCKIAKQQFKFDPVCYYYDSLLIDQTDHSNQFCIKNKDILRINGEMNLVVLLATCHLHGDV